MGDLQTLHKTARSLILSLREGLEHLEKSEQVFAQHAQATGQAQHLRSKLADLQRVSQQLDGAWRMQALRDNSSMTDIWKRKVEQVVEEADDLRTALDKHTHRVRRRQAEEEDRAQLLARTDANGAAGWRAGLLDDDAQSMNYVQNSKRVLEEAFQTGTAILTNMSGQRERLKATQRKMLDVLNSTGLSDRLLRLIDRRQRLDAWIVYGGMLSTVILLGGLLWWLRR